MRSNGMGPLAGGWIPAGARLLAVSGLVLLGGVACESEALVVPTAEEARGYYQANPDLSVAVSGNVVELTVEQSTAQLRRGGSLWARVGPYVYLFSPPTQSLFQDYNGLAAVRVITTTSQGTEVARATLPRANLNDLTWARALNISGKARRDGSTQLTLLEDLIQWGEDHTEYEYNPRYTARR